MIRFRASLYHRFTGYKLVSARDMVIPNTKKLSCIRVVRSVQSKGFESLKRPLHTSTNDDDDFAELGLPVERGGYMIPKLMTKKPEPFLKTSDTKKNQQKWGSLLQFLFLDLENSNDGTSNFRTSSSIMIKNVPSMINVLKEANFSFWQDLKGFKEVTFK